VEQIVSAKAVILVVDSDRSNLELLSQQLDREGYGTVEGASLDELDQTIQGKARIALSLIDISGFDQRIWERCEALVKSGTPFIVISPRRSPAVQRESMKCGASGLLTKPLSFTDLMECVRTVLGD
jgi:DNA-binding NtrC family response regulator